MATGVKIEEVMTAKVAHVNPGCSIDDAIARMAKDRISCLLVCEGDWPIGIVTERDVVGFVAQNRGSIPTSDGSVSEIMTSPVDTIVVTSTLDDLLLMLRERSYRHLPVTDEAGSLVGVVTQSDLVRACAMVIEELDKENREVLDLS